MASLKRSNKKEVIFMRVSNKLKEQVERMAKEDEKSVSEFIRDLINNEIVRRRKKA